MSVQYRCMVGTNRTIGTSTHPMVLLGDESQVVSRFSPFGDSIILTQDRCMVCTERTIGSEIVLDASEGTPW